MTTGSLDRSRLRGALESEIAAFVGALHGDPRRPVPACPGWDMQELCWHLGEVQASWARNLRLRGAAPTKPIARPEQVTIEWYREQADDLLAALDASQPDDPCWNWTGADFTAAWVVRRQAHEAAVHRWDAESAAGDPMAIDVDLAIDGIDELFDVFLAAAVRGRWLTPEAAQPPVPWRIETTDVPSTRQIGTGDGATVTGGAANDVLLALWGRVPFDVLLTPGDVAVHAWWRGLPIFD